MRALATAHAGTLKMAWQKDRMINREIKTRGLFTHSQPSAINSNLPSTSHNEAPRSTLVCFDDVFRCNNGDILYNVCQCRMAPDASAPD